MRISLKDYRETLRDLSKNKKVCVRNRSFLKEDKIALSVYEANCEGFEDLLRLKTIVNDRFYLNEELISKLTDAIKYFKNVKEYDQVFNNYIRDYQTSANRFVEISSDPDFIKLASAYIPNSFPKFKSVEPEDRKIIIEETDETKSDKDDITFLL